MIKDIEGLIEKVTKEIRDFTDVATIGLSGGADSTLVAILCMKALGAKNVNGLHMPYNDLDRETFNSRSVALAEKLEINSSLIGIGAAVDTLSGQFQFDTLSKLNQGNMRSRMRMVSLYTHNCITAEESGKRCRVIGTGVLSEDLIGYDTKGGRLDG